MYITNPSLPYCSPIGSRLTPGSLIRITGTVSSYATTFAINLQCGPSVNPRDDVALHLSPVFTSPPRIVRNTIQSNRWGPEESFGGLPLSTGSSFEFLILIETSEFKIALNGNHFTEFHYRLPIERVTHIAVDGDCTISTIKLEGTPYSSASAPPPIDNVPYASAPPPYPVGGLAGMGPGLYPSLDSSGMAPYPQPQTNPYPPSGAYQPPGAYPPTGPYPPSGPYPSAGPYPTNPAGAYPQGGYAPPGPYPSGGYPSAGSNIPAPPPPGYPQGGSSSNKGIGGMIGSAIGGLTAGAAATSIGSALFGNKHSKHHAPHGMGHKKSSPLPMGALAAGAGALGIGALGAAALSHVHPFKKVKKAFKHKHKGWSHKGWSSSSSSSEEEE
ncbi:hypothetical protein RDWZM_009563 [Blomia tropicalis]|uniref:Galectin n=1 Tax=Blomia tropicalis TaxID=40697 RepID=A0A9Q0RL69_BLOTA|nr:Galectin [Blomia tropicalis]KAJ6218406.1 hypothetical protein RDWZM_009563 [Blomia tropicalis]